MVTTRSAARSHASSRSYSYNPFDDDALSTSAPAIDPSGSTDANPFDVYEVPATDGANSYADANSYAATSNYSSHRTTVNDAVLSELKALNSHMLRALDALTFLTAQATSNQPPTQPSPTFSPASATRPGYVPNFSATGHSSGHSQNVSEHPSHSRPRVSPHQPQPPNPPADDVSVSDSITSGISISSIRTSRTLRDAIQDMVKDSKSKTIKLPQLEDRLQEPS
jgi:hypothetical protein